MLGAARERGLDRWVSSWSRSRTASATASSATSARPPRVRAAFGPEDSIRDALADDVTEPAIVAADRLLKALARHELRADR